MKQKSYGFTIVELLGVLLILSIIIGISIPSFSAISVSNKNSMFINIANSLLQSAKTYMIVHSDNQPNKGQSVYIGLKTLVQEGYMSVPKNPYENSENCSVNNSFVTVTNENDNLIYRVTLECGEQMINNVLEDDLNADKITSVRYMEFSDWYDSTETFPTGALIQDKQVYKNIYWGISFDGNGYATVPHSDFFDVRKFTLEAQIDFRGVSSPGGIIISKDSVFGLAVINNKLRANVGTTEVISNLTVPTDRIVTVAATWNGSKIVFYVDTEKEEKTISAEIETVNESGLGIGAGGVPDDGLGASETNRFKGKILEIKIYNRALLEHELFKTERQVDPYDDTLIAYYKINEGGNLIPNGDFKNGEHIPIEGGSNPKNNIVIHSNPLGTYWVLRQTSAGGSPHTEYQLNVTGFKPNTTYTMSCWVAYTSDWNGGNYVLHYRYYTKSNVAKSGNPVGETVETRVINGITWERKKYTLTMDSDIDNNTEFYWYLGYNSTGNTKGYRYVTGIQLEEGSEATEFKNSGYLKDYSFYGHDAKLTGGTWYQNERWLDYPTNSEMVSNQYRYSELLSADKVSPYVITKVEGTDLTVRGIEENYLSFNGTKNNQVVLPSGVLNDRETYGGKNKSKSTFTAWLRPNSLDDYNGFASCLSFYYFAIQKNTRLILMVKNSDDSANYWPKVSTNKININQWNHIVFIIEDGIGYKFYVNGELILDKSDPEVRIGNYSGKTPGLGVFYEGTGFLGSMRDVTLWKKALTKEEVENIYYNTGFDISDPNLLGHWKFDEGKGDVLTDYSGNNFNGEIIGATWVKNNSGVKKTSLYKHDENGDFNLAEPYEVTYSDTATFYDLEKGFYTVIVEDRIGNKGSKVVQIR